MSLKIFHIIFIIASILLTFGFGGWAYHFYTKGAQTLYLCYTALSFVFGILLSLYLVKVMKKLFHLDDKK